MPAVGSQLAGLGLGTESAGGLVRGHCTASGVLVLPQSQPSAEGFRASGRQALQGPH